MRRRLVQAGPTVGRVRAVPGVDGTGVVRQPPPGSGQAVQGFCVLVARELGFEQGSRQFPFGLAQRVPSRSRNLWSLRVHRPDHRIGGHAPLDS